MEVRGVFSSCDTLDKKFAFMASNLRSCVMNRNMKKEPKMTVMSANSISPYIRNIRWRVSLRISCMSFSYKVNSQSRASEISR